MKQNEHTKHSNEEMLDQLSRVEVSVSESFTEQTIQRLFGGALSPMELKLTISRYTRYAAVLAGLILLNSIGGWYVSHHGKDDKSRLSERQEILIEAFMTTH